MRMTLLEKVAVLLEKSGTFTAYEEKWLARALDMLFEVRTILYSCPSPLMLTAIVGAVPANFEVVLCAGLFYIRRGGEEGGLCSQ